MPFVSRVLRSDRKLTMDTIEKMKQPKSKSTQEKHFTGNDFILGREKTTRSIKNIRNLNGSDSN